MRVLTYYVYHVCKYTLRNAVVCTIPILVYTTILFYDFLRSIVVTLCRKGIGDIHTATQYCMYSKRCLHTML